MSKQHRKVQVVVTAGSELLLLKTNERRGSFWQNITGSVEKDEDYFTAAKREFEEETGGDPEKGTWSDLDLDFTFHDQWERTVHEKCYHVHFEKKFKIQLDPSEHSNEEWILIKNINKNSVKYESNYQAILKSKQALS